MTTESVDLSGLDGIRSENRRHAGLSDAPGSKWTMYGFKSAGDVSEFAPVGGRLKVTATGSAHNFAGALKKNDPETLSVLKHLEEKIVSRRGEMSVVKEDLQNDADTLLISFGITARTAKEPVRKARASGKKVSFMTIHSLFPVPEEIIKRSSEKVSRVVIAEENLTGQYRKVIENLFPGKKVSGVNKIGSMITPEEILGAL